MKKYNPTQYNRTIWYDQSRTKNHPRNCKQHHRFCSLDYQWNDNTPTLDHMNLPINQNIPNITLPKPQQRGDLKHQFMTEQGLDDWIAQSMNRNLNSMLNPNKKFFIPPTLEQQLKTRYRKQRKSLKPQPDTSYFRTLNSTIKQQQKSYLSHKKNKTLDISQLVFDYKKLQPKSTGRTLIRSRQQKHPVTISSKSQPKRRQAVLLEKDLHYQRFTRVERQQGDGRSMDVKEDRKIIESLNRNKMFMLNYEAMRRERDGRDVPSSITDYDGIRIAMPVETFSLDKNSMAEKRRQEEQHQAYRIKGNAQAEQAYSVMENFSQRSRPTQYSKPSSSIQSKSKPSEQMTQMSQMPQTPYISAPRTLSSLSLPQQTTHLAKKPSIPSNKPQLQKRVITLLQSMHVQSQHISQIMATFALHPCFLPFSALDLSNHAHLWIKKAQQQLQRQNHPTAFECYKQAIIAQPELFNSVYNFAVLLERENRLNCALEWFLMAKEFECDRELVTFAVALVYLKMEKFQEAYKEINDLISFLLHRKVQVAVSYYYIRALCLKNFGKYQPSKKDYKLVLQHSRPSNHQDLAKFLLSFIFAKKRRYKPHLGCFSYVKFRQMAIASLYDKGERIRGEQSNKELATKLKDRVFWRRFPLKLVQKIISQSNYQHHQPNQVLFVKPQESIIVISGLVQVKNHQKSIQLHQITALLQQGCFVASSEIDSGLNGNLNNWYHTRTEVEILRLNSQEFQSLWAGQVTFWVDFKYNYLKNLAIFQGLSDKTLFWLCEMMSKTTFSKGHVVWNDGEYMVNKVNKEGCGFGLVVPKVQTNVKGNTEEFTQLKFEGLFVVKSGKIKVQDHQGFCCTDVISQGDFFGQNLVLQAIEGFGHCGRLVVQSQTAQFYLLKLQDIVWGFSSQDKKIMRNNCLNQQKRKSLQLVKDLRKRYQEYLQVHHKYKTIDN